MPEIDPKLAQKPILDADLANMAKRVRWARRTSRQISVANFMQATGQIALPESGVAKNKVAFWHPWCHEADNLQVAMHEDCPVPNSDGTYNIADWLAFIKLHGLKGSEDDSGMDLRDRKMLGQYLKMFAELTASKGQLGFPKEMVMRFAWKMCSRLVAQNSALADGRQSEGRSVE